MTTPRSIEPARVIIVSHTGELGGAEVALVRLLEARDRERFDVTAIVLEDGAFPERLRALGVPTRVLASGRLARVTRQAAASSVTAIWRNATASIGVARRLRRVLREEHAELVVANSLKGAVIVSMARPRRVPWVWHLHDRLAPDYLPGPVAVALRVLARFGPRRLLVNSRATAQTLHGVPADRVVVAYPGLPSAAFEEERRAKDAEAAAVVGIVGRISATKGQRVFLEAARRMAASRPGVRFRIVGGALFEDAPEEADLRELVTRSPELTASVEWAGWTTDAEAELRRLTVAVHASPVPEPFGQVIVEAMAAGTPVVGADAGGVPEIIDPGGTAVALVDGVRRGGFGLLVRPGDESALADAVGWMLDHPTDADAMANAARVSAKDRFAIENTWSTVARTWSLALTASRRRGTRSRRADSRPAVATAAVDSRPEPRDEAGELDE